MSTTVAARSQATIKLGKRIREDVVIAQAMSSYSNVRAQGKIENKELVACVFNNTDKEWKGNVCWIAR